MDWNFGRSKHLLRCLSINYSQLKGKGSVGESQLKIAAFHHYLLFHAHFIA